MHKNIYMKATIVGDRISWLKVKRVWVIKASTDSVFLNNSFHLKKIKDVSVSSSEESTTFKKVCFIDILVHFKIIRTRRPKKSRWCHCTDLESSLSHATATMQALHATRK